MTRALLLSGSIGHGHDSVADACVEALGAAGVEVRVRDCMKLLGTLRRSFGVHAYRRILSFPGVFDAFHFAQLRDGGRLADRADHAASRVLAERLAPDLAWVGDGMVISVFATGAGAAALSKSKGLPARSIAMVTDATAHRLWVHEETDLFLVGSHLTATTVRQHRPLAPIAILPPAVRSGFYGAPSREDARRALGLPESAQVALLMTSGWGIGPLVESASELTREGWWVLGVAGSNRRVERRLWRLARTLHQDPSAKGGLVPFGFTRRVPELMAACDVVITSSGQACHEARVVGRPMVLLDIVPGHGRENMLHELEQGGAMACLGNARSVAAAADASLALPGDAEPWPLSTAAEWSERFAASLAEAGVEL